MDEARGMGMHGRAVPAEARSGQASGNLWNWSTGNSELSSMDAED